jgi:tagatose 1,6-diphosphate aldolase GatY/KbaY
MLLAGASVLDEARREGRAVPGFVAYNLETAQGIVAAAERTGLPVLVQAGSSAFRHAGLHPLAGLCLDLARRSEAGIGVHLDHSRSLEEITTCLELGYTSVMVDGSHLPLADNIALTRQVVARAHDLGAWVEAELGPIAGDEDRSTDAVAGAMTDVGQAEDLVEATGVDALAVAVGNVHGFSAAPPRIDLERLAALRDRVRVPLVLHGASGLPDDLLLACVGLGVAKVNVNAELRRAFLAAVEGALPAAVADVDVTAPLAAGRDAVAATAARITLTVAGRARRLLDGACP